MRTSSICQKNCRLTGEFTVKWLFFCYSKNMFTKTKEMLDAMHKAKIDMADSIYVINVGGYVGSSTKSEIEYAIAHGKEVRYLEEP